MTLAEARGGWWDGMRASRVREGSSERLGR